jgi:glycerol-3-phosphate dehydrogenase
MQRADLALLQSQRFDLIVIGGGINGSAIARDASMRGMTVALIEREDLASGTSAWSSRLIHGGLRYLEHREFGLVRESLREREILLRNAPHLVKPLGMFVPIYSGAKRGPLTIRAGMAMYDALSYDKSLARHHMLSASQLEAELPGLDAIGLKAGAYYFDAQATFAERLVIEQAVSAWEHGARIATRMRVTGIETEGSVVRGVTVSDEISGESGVVSGRLVVNVAGPWVDAVLSGAPAGTVQKRFIGGTKGSHLVVSAWKGAPDEALYYESRSDGRPILIIPWNGMMLLGSTDLRFDGDLDRVEASDEEITYLLAEVNSLFPTVKLTSDDVHYSYAGVRPLPHVTSGSAGAITRRHSIVDHGPGLKGLWSIVGGKLTTHRSLAEEVVDRAARVLDRSAECQTESAPLPGAAGITFGAFRDGLARQVEDLGLERRVGLRLAGLYGVRAERILDLVRENPVYGATVDPESGGIAAEVLFAVRDEAATTLSDIMLRRTMLAYGSAAGIGVDQTVLDTVGKTIGWSKPKQKAELSAYRAWITRYRPRSLTKV